MTTHDDSTIMIVDDEPANLKLLDKILDGQGYTRRICLDDPRQVLPEYARLRPDLILLDLNMPHLDGYQIMEQLRALGDPLLPPILVLTAEYGHGSLLKALALGARDYLSKPFERTELLMRVRNLLDGRRAHRITHEQNVVLEEMVRRRTEEVVATRLQIIQRLGRAAEYRDNETGLHVLRMAHTAALLAERLGWDAADVELMLHASPMHDIGKIGIPDAILLKPGKLDDEEWRIMKGHVAIGAELLAGDDFPLLRLAREIALHHHEKWDGSGYPSGLAGADIPQSARIATVADVFDALISVRPYKPAWSIEQAVSFMRQQSGKHFDPEIVDVFLSSLDDILRIAERYREPDGLKAA
ncbi:two-component system response regulator [Oxalicibacterium flavum]|uniref:Two-component system response regulator n=1 Tax=Oxalicibacterium flavum TaxID=179467 RepID=A0A8J2UJF0_9BURK|nr:HD domain-containing phosphohydrolase [Oxalicibacterium flavum]GGB95666.1 two-component system response regulator [Oxalicibacterium flavum]